MPFVTALVPEVDVAGGRRRGRGPARAWSRRCRGRRRRRREARRPHDLPRLPRRRSTCRCPGKAARQGPARRCTSTTCGTWTHDRHRTVDDTPYGGGAGMVMKPEPWGEAFDALGDRRRDASSCPRRPGSRSARRWPASWPTRERLVFACGRYEGIDQRVLDHAATPGRGARGLARRLRAQRRRGRGRWRSPRRSSGCCPGFMGNPESLAEESHEDGLLEYPVYTKPAVVARPRRARRCCCPATTPRSRPGGTSRPGGVPRSDGPTCCTPSLRDHASGRSCRRSRATPASCCTLQRACWVQEALANDSLADIPALHESLDDVLAWMRDLVDLGGPQRGPAGRRRARPARGATDRLGHRPADGRARPPGPRARPARCSPHIEAVAPPEATSYALFTGARSADNIRMYKKAGYRRAHRPRGARRAPWSSTKRAPA